MAIKLPDGRIARTLPEQVDKNMQDIAFLMNKKDFKIEVVEELPETGEDGVLYLVPSDDPDQDNVYDEYIWTGTAFEKVGTTAVDISNMVTTNTDQDITGQKTIKSILTIDNDATLSLELGSNIYGDLIPHDDDIDDIGDSTYYWRDLYLSTNVFFGTAYKITRDTNYLRFYVGTTARFSIGASESYINCNLLPSGTNDLGGSSNKWNNFYVAGDINISKSGETTTWLLAEQTGGSLLLKRSNAGVMSFASSYFSSYSHRPIAANTYDLGSSATTWKDLYLSGVLSDGTNSVNIADLKALIDYAKAQGWIS